MSPGIVLRESLVRPFEGKPWRQFLWFAYLQGLDLLSTLAVLITGLEEGNPLVRAAMDWSGSPAVGLLMVKLLGFTLGLFCLATRRGGLLLRINVFYAVIVAWNLLVLLVGLTR